MIRVSNIKSFILVVAMSLPLMVDAGYSQQQLEAQCMAHADNIANIAYFRDEGVPMWQMIEFIQNNDKLEPVVKDNIIFNIKRIYARADLTPKQMYDMSYESCLNPPIEM